ncbi:MAG: HAMP domain-containing protein [Anaerolineae bacterium]|nr:HAMP domain-containing protein [Anaerolineae bacterium]
MSYPLPIPTHIPRSAFRLPLWAMLTIPFITLLVAAISLTGFLALRNSKNAVHDIAEQLIDEIMDRIDVHLASFLETPHQINTANADLMRLGLLDSTDQAAMQQYLWEQVQRYDDVTSIYVGNPRGGLIVGGREGADGSLYIMVSDDFAAGPMYKYATDTTGQPTDTLAEIAYFDARLRPWYDGALARQGASWSPPYALSTGQDLAIAASRPVYDEAGELLGVASVDLFFSHVSNFLQGVDFGQTGQAYIVDDEGLLIATSTGTVTFVDNNGAAANTVGRIAAVNSADPIIAATANYLIENFSAFPDSEQYLRTEINGVAYYLRTSPYSDPRGLEWVIVIAIPEADFLAKLDDHNRVTIALTLVALGLAIIAGIITALRVLRPITRLNEAAAALGQNDWSQTVPVTGPREIQQLGETFNAMASQLRELFTHLEDRVQERTEAVIASETRYRAIVEDQTELICRFMPGNILTFVNGAYCRYFDKTREELIGHSFMPRVPESDQAQLAAELANLTSDNLVIITEHRVIKPDPEKPEGELRWLQWVNRVLVDESDTLIEIQAVGRDITEQKQLALTLQKALDHEIELNQLKSHFLSTVSHEFRTPLAIILSSSELLERYRHKMTPDKQYELFRRIEAQISRMAFLLDDVLAINKAQRGPAEFVPKAVDLTALCQKAIHDIRTASEKVLTFAFEADERCTTIKADDELVRLIMHNLISNAAKYSHPGGTITIKLTCTDKDIVFTVQDHGIGIPLTAQPQIFTPFYRAANIGTQPGTGLGLAIAKQSVDQHGGTLSFESEEGKGSTFTVIIPNIAFWERQHANDFSD